jgi:hypothetical protein
MCLVLKLSMYLFPYSGTVVKVVSVLEGALTVADATVTVSDSSAASMGTLTIAFTSSAAGDVDTLAPASNNTVTDNDYHYHCY